MGEWASARRVVGVVLKLINSGAPTPCMDQYSVSVEAQSIQVLIVPLPLGFSFIETE